MPRRTTFSGKSRGETYARTLAITEEAFRYIAYTNFLCTKINTLPASHDVMFVP